jgi:hypothetical protein
LRSIGPTTGSRCPSPHGGRQSRTLAGPLEVIPNGISLPNASTRVAKRQRRLHRPQRAAQGPRGPPARVAGGGCPDRGAPSRRRRRTLCRALARAPAGLSLERVDLLGGCRGEPDQRARGGEPPCGARLGGESFGMVLTRAFATATPAVASDIEGYAAVADESSARARPARRRTRLSRARSSSFSGRAAPRGPGAGAARLRSSTRGTHRAPARRDLRAAGGRRDGRTGGRLMSPAAEPRRSLRPARVLAGS